MRITYLFESTTLWGGNKVALEQAEALAGIGYRITILSKDSGPSWYPLKLPVLSAPVLDSTTIPESDVIVGTYWPTVKAAYESGRGVAVHLCQGYEGGNKELLSFKEAIDEVYSYKIPKLTVSPHLESFLKERFGAETYYIGQMINRDFFFPGRKKKGLLRIPGRNAFTILVVGPFEADVKNIPTALRGISLAKKRLKIPLKLIRASQFPLTEEEREIIEPDTYHFSVPYHAMGEIYRKADLVVSMSKEAEGFGLPPLEAMACGIPVILSKISSHFGYDELRDYAVFAESYPEALANAILSVYRNPELRHFLSQRGLSVSDKFTRESVLSRLTSAFKEIIRRRGIKGTVKDSKGNPIS